MSNLVIKTAKLPEEFTSVQEIRRLVYQIEQGIDPTLELDGKDKISEHIIAYLNNKPVGTARIRYLDNTTAKIERLAVLETARGQGIGKKIMEKALDIIKQKNMQEVVIHAQEYIKKLHEQISFQQEGEPFEEAGILHVKMRRKLG